MGRLKNAVQSLGDSDDDDEGGRGKRGGSAMHAWQGPRRQALGGIQANYDWRPMEPLRPIHIQGSRAGEEGEEEEPGSDPMFTHPLDEAFKDDDWSATEATFTPENGGATGINGSYGKPRKTDVTTGSNWQKMSANLSTAPGSVSA